MNFIQHPIFSISGAIILGLILIATFLRAWGIEIPAKWVFSYAALIIVPIVATIYYLVTPKQ